MAGVEPSHTKFNLTYPPQPFNNTGIVLDTSPAISSILAGLLVPHVVCTIFLLARVYSRLFILRKWFHDDTLILSAWLFSTAVCTVYSLAATTPDLSSAVLLGNNTLYTRTTYLGLIFYQLALLLTKLSILSFYLRMFSSRPIERRLAIGTIVVVIAYGIPLLTISVLQCQPTSSSFLSTTPPAGMKCFTFRPLLIASSSLHTATDAWLILMIAPVISRLAIPRGQKVALTTVLSLSIFVIAASLTRLQLSLHAAGYYYSHPDTSSGSDAAAPADRVGNTLSFFVMTVLECDVALLCACAPTLRPVLARMWPVFMRDGGPGNGGGGERRRRLRRRRRPEGQSGADGEGEDDSVNLTVVSYHGYPWAQNTAPPAAGGSRSKDDVAGEMAMSMPVPPPPPPAMLRTPTTLSLRSFMSSMAPRSRGQTVSGREDREVLLGDEAERKRRSSVGFEGYYDQYMGYGEDNGKRRSRLRDSLVEGARGQWGDSQESFVLGVNDPASPSRLSPISALSGETADAVGESKEGRDGRNA